jgi:pimeloyl-ACP methyl ester carboxylesterase
MNLGRPAPLRCVTVGNGRTIVLLHGYGMQPETYLPMARLLAARVRVVIPSLFELPEWWTYDHAMECLELTLADQGVDRMSLLGHSFSGGLELGIAARHPERVMECVFGDTLAVARELSLAREFLSHPPGAILRMATAPALMAFTRSWLTHPAQLVSAALWGFADNRDDEIQVVAEADIPCHVLWASHDTILSRRDGQEFAKRLHATFTVAGSPPGYGPIDHDWMFDDPALFVKHLEQLDLRVLEGTTPSIV